MSEIPAQAQQASLQAVAKNLSVCGNASTEQANAGSNEPPSSPKTSVLEPKRDDQRSGQRGGVPNVPKVLQQQQEVLEKVRSFRSSLEASTYAEPETVIPTGLEEYVTATFDASQQEVCFWFVLFYSNGS